MHKIIRNYIETTKEITNLINMGIEVWNKLNYTKKPIPTSNDYLDWEFKIDGLNVLIEWNSGQEYKYIPIKFFTLNEISINKLIIENNKYDKVLHCIEELFASNRGGYTLDEVEFLSDLQVKYNGKKEHIKETLKHLEEQ